MKHQSDEDPEIQGEQVLVSEWRCTLEMRESAIFHQGSKVHGVNQEEPHIDLGLGGLLLTVIIPLQGSKANAKSGIKVTDVIENMAESGRFGTDKDRVREMGEVFSSKEKLVSMNEIRLKVCVWSQDGNENPVLLTEAESPSPVRNQKHVSTVKLGVKRVLTGSKLCINAESDQEVNVLLTHKVNAVTAEMVVVNLSADRDNTAVHPGVQSQVKQLLSQVKNVRLEHGVLVTCSVPPQNQDLLALLASQKLGLGLEISREGDSAHREREVVDLQFTPTCQACRACRARSSEVGRDLVKLELLGILAEKRKLEEAIARYEEKSRELQETLLGRHRILRGEHGH